MCCDAGRPRCLGVGFVISVLERRKEKQEEEDKEEEEEEEF